MKRKRKLKCYSVTLDSDVYAVSLVDDPAIEETFIALGKEKPLRIFLEENEKRIVMGAVLVPDKPIYRNQDGEEFYITFSADTIEKLAHDFLRMGRNYNFSYQHDGAVEGVSVIESWIVSDTEMDKSAQYGMKLPKGTWVMAAKIDNEELWRSIKNGDAKGFSIEAIVNLDEIKLKKDNEIMNEDKDVKMESVEITDGFWDKLRQIISEALGKPQEDAQVDETVGKITDEIQKGAVEEETNMEVVEQAEENVESSPKTDAIAEEVINDVNEQAETQEQAQEDLQAVIDALRAEIAAKDEEIANLKKENQKLSKQPSVKPVKTEMSEHKMSPFEVVEALRNGTYFK